MAGPIRSGPPRAAPWPGDIRLGNEVYRLQPQQGGGLVAVKVPDQGPVAPSTYGYAAQDPRYEGVQLYGRMSKGYGLGMQETADDQAYFYATGVDASVYPWLAGPAITIVRPTTADTTNGISRFFVLNGRLYALNGRYCLVRGGDTGATWTVSKDFNDYAAGTLGSDVYVFYSPALAQARAWVGFGTSAQNFAHFTGATGTTTWAQVTGMTARAFVVAGREFYRAIDPNTLAKCDTNADPTSSANWNGTNQYRVGDLSTSILRLTVNAEGVLVILANDGIYSLDEVGQDIEYFKDLRDTAAATNALGFAHFSDQGGDALYVNYGQGYYRLSPAFERLPAGPERQLRGGAEAVNPVRGRITAGLGHYTHRLYAGIYSGTDAYLMVMNPDGIWHGSLSDSLTDGPTSRNYVTAMFRSSIGAASGKTRCYLGFDNGDVGWFTLPADPYPDDDPDYTFRATAGILYCPLWHGGFLTDPKALRKVTIGGPLLNSTNYAQLDYRLNPSTSGWTALGENFDSAGAEVEDFTAGLVTTLGAFRVQLVPPTTAGASSPQVAGVGIHWSRRPVLTKTYSFAILAEDGLTLRNGAVMRRGARDIRTAIQAAASAGSSTLILPSEESRQVAIVDYREGQEWDNRLRRWRAVLQVEATEAQTGVSQGAYGNLEQRTYGQLEALGSYAALETLV